MKIQDAKQQWTRNGRSSKVAGMANYQSKEQKKEVIQEAQKE